MCGINGIFAYHSAASPIDHVELLATRDHMRRRGPDGKGDWVSADALIGLGHRRLSIIDLTGAGAQPMVNADGTLVVTFNGEIYNYRELRAKLEAQGHVFRSQSDTEVLLHLYAEKREAMLGDLRGMFAFAIWDAREQSLFLARDPFGIKPLYVHDDGQSIRFASQVKALLAGGAIPSNRSPEGEAGYWIWGHVPEPYTLYQGIRALEPGTWRVIRRGGKQTVGTAETVGHFLSLPGPLATEIETSHHTPLRDVLLDSMRHHLISDVPVCIFLSAGIDSSALLALAGECAGKVSTITVGFEEFKGTPEDETVLAEEVARLYGADHHTVWISRSDFEKVLDDFLDAMDQPSIDGLNTWLVCRAAAQLGFKVALSGLGGDEFFAGYPSFKQLPMMRRIAQPFSFVPGIGRMLRRATAPVLSRFTSEKFAGLLEYGNTWDGAYMLRRALRMPWEITPGVATVAVAPCKLETGNTSDHLTVSQLELTRYMRNQLLRDADWSSRAHSVELRVPLVDKVVACRVAAEAHRAEPWRKHDLADCALPPLPRDITSRPKTGFGVPVREWLMAKTPSRQERGLRAWQSYIFSRSQGLGTS